MEEVVRRKRQRREIVVMDDELKRLCLPCGQYRTIHDFPRFKRSPDGWGYTCKPCMRAGAARLATTRSSEEKRERRAPWKKTPEDNRRYNLQSKYGLSMEDFDALFAEQDGKCALCRRPIESPQVDHCHKTGTVRGILCVGCNTALGKFNDDPALLERAIVYINRWAPKREGEYLILTLRVPDPTYLKYCEHNPNNPQLAMEQQLERFKDIRTKDRPLILRGQELRDLEALFGQPIEDINEFIRWVEHLKSVKVGDMAFPLSKGQLKRMEGEANFYAQPVKVYMEKRLKTALDNSLGGVD